LPRVAAVRRAAGGSPINQFPGRKGIGSSPNGIKSYCSAGGQSCFITTELGWLDRVSPRHDHRPAAHSFDRRVSATGRAMGSDRLRHFDTTSRRSADSSPADGGVSCCLGRNAWRQSPPAGHGNNLWGPLPPPGMPRTRINYEEWNSSSRRHANLSLLPRADGIRNSPIYTMDATGLISRFRRFLGISIGRGG